MRTGESRTIKFFADETHYFNIWPRQGNGKLYNSYLTDKVGRGIGIRNQLIHSTHSKKISERTSVFQVTFIPHALQPGTIYLLCLEALYLAKETHIIWEQERNQHLLRVPLDALIYRY